MYRTAEPPPCSCAELVPNPCWSCSPWIRHEGPCPTPEKHRCVVHGTFACNNCGRIVDHGYVSSDGVCDHTNADIYGAKPKSKVRYVVGLAVAVAAIGILLMVLR